jgi:hypothetical protein
MCISLKSAKNLQFRVAVKYQKTGRIYENFGGEKFQSGRGF